MPLTLGARIREDSEQDADSVLEVGVRVGGKVWEGKLEMKAGARKPPGHTGCLSPRRLPHQNTADWGS